MTSSFEEASTRVRMLKKGELLEVLEWDRTDDTSGIARMRVKAKSDNAQGWATRIGLDGRPLLEVL